jgi:hypothetical protein
MATRKQKARRAKTFRHDYALVVDDEEGNEVEISSAEARSKTGTGGTKTVAKPKSGSTARGLREPPAPSWRRSLKRGLPWGLAAAVIVTFLLHGSPVIGLVYALMFVPLTYWTDSMVYRRWQRKQAGPPPPKAKKSG